MRKGLLKWAWAFAGVALMLSASVPVSARGEIGRGKKPLRADVAIDIVHQLYAKAERYTAASGTPVVVEVKGCRALYRRDFPREAFTQLFDLPADRALELSATVLSDPGLGVSGASFRARWIDAADNGGGSGIRAAVEGASIAEILTRLRVEDQDFNRRIEPIVSCGVTVAAEGESRSYQAAFFFSPGAVGEPRFFADHVVIGLERLARETLPPTRDFAELRARVDLNAWLTAQTPSLAKTICVEDEEAGIKPSILRRGTEEHVTGAHASQITLGGLCRETANCISECTPALGITGCGESGEIDSLIKTHRRFTETHTEGDSQFNAPSSCKAALGCAVESCLFGVCRGLQLSLIRSRVGSISYTTTPAPLWNGNVADVFTCPPPEPLPDSGGGGQDPNPGGALDPDPNPGGSSGGGSPPRSGCWWYCVPRWSGGIYYEDCSLRC